MVLLLPTGGPIVGFEVFDALDRDWGLFVTSRTARRAIAAWSADPTLGRYGSLDEVIAALRTRTLGVVVKNDILAALAHRAPSDDVAARTLLQAIVPGLVNVAKRVRAVQRDAQVDLVGEAFALVQSYPI